MIIPKSVYLKHTRGHSHATLTEQPVFEFDGHCVEILEDFGVNGADVPRIFRAFMSPYAGDHLPASVLHDALYAAQHFSRDYTDRLYMRMLLVVWTEKYTRYAAALENRIAAVKGRRLRKIVPALRLVPRALRYLAPAMAATGAHSVYWFLFSLGWMRWHSYSQETINLSREQISLTAV